MDDTGIPSPAAGSDFLHPADLSAAVYRYEKGITIRDDRRSEVNVRWGRVLPQWNYTIRPRLN